MVQQEATLILPAFREKTMQAKELAVHHFMKFVGLTQHATSYSMQKNFLEAEADAKNFIAMMKVKLEGRNPDDVLNMNQTPTPHSFHASKMLDKNDKKTVNALLPQPTQSMSPSLQVE